MSDIIRLITIITPTPGKIDVVLSNQIEFYERRNRWPDKVIEKMAPFNEFVEANEPGTLQGELFRQVNGDNEVLVYMEMYV